MIKLNIKDADEPKPIKKPEAKPAPVKKVVKKEEKPDKSPKGHFDGPATISPKASLGGKEPGRNDPCPCGSGKKYKKCHGKNI